MHAGRRVSLQAHALHQGLGPGTGAAQGVGNQYAHYLRAHLLPTMKTLKAFLRPNQTTMVDIVLKRFVREGVFALTRNRGPDDFRKQPTGEILD